MGHGGSRPFDGLVRRARELTPRELAHRPVRRRMVEWRGVATLALFEINDRLIDRFASAAPARWSPNIYSWAQEVEAAWPDMRREVEAYARRRAMPDIASVAGFTPGSDEARASVPADRGVWRAIHLAMFGRAIPENAVQFPKTMAAFANVRADSSIGFTALDGDSHIAEHVGPNRGALRYQLPIIVPGAPGDCRIRVGDEMIEWREGECVVFDLSVPHEVWNDTDQLRVLLMIEVPMPLPFPVSALNRVTQWCSRFYPPNYRLAERAAAMATDETMVTVPA